MGSDTSQQQDLLPLTPAVFHILLALAPGELHGYAIMQQVDKDSQGRVQMGPGTLYGTVKRMLASRLIEEWDERPIPELDDERRRYYRLTEAGQKVLAAEVERLSNLVKVARSKQLSGKSSLSLAREWFVVGRDVLSRPLLSDLI